MYEKNSLEIVNLNVKWRVSFPFCIMYVNAPCRDWCSMTLSNLDDMSYMEGRGKD